MNNVHGTRLATGRAARNYVLLSFFTDGRHSCFNFNVVNAVKNDGVFRQKRFCGFYFDEIFNLPAVAERIDRVDSFCRRIDFRFTINPCHRLQLTVRIALCDII